MQLNRSYIYLIFAFFLFVYLLPLGSRDLLSPDETRYGEIPREMIASGDWVVPHLNGLRYFEKPPLGYWIHAGSLLLFGENNFSVRFPSALAAGLSSILIFLLVNQIRRKEQQEDSFPALLATLIYLSSFEVAAVGNIAVLDSLFSFFVTATIASYYWATKSAPRSSRERLFLILAGLLCGLTILAKGFLGIVIPVLVLAPYLVWQRRYMDLLRMSWLPIVVAILVVLPWSIAIHLREPDFWRYFIWNEHIRRFVNNDAQHKQSFFFFFMTAPVQVMPWFFLIPATLAGLRQLPPATSDQGRLLRLSMCWLVLPFLFFSASKGKLLTYILPCFPPFAILMAYGLSHIVEKGRKKILQWGIVATGIFFAVLLLAFLYTQLLGDMKLHLFSEHWKTAMVASGILSLVVFCYWSLRCQSDKMKVMLLGLAPLLLLYLAHYTIPDTVITKSAPGRLLEQYQQDIKADTVVIACEESIGAVDWNLRRSDVYILQPPGELAYGLQYQDAAGRLLDIASATQLINENRGKVAIIGRTDKIRDLQKVIPYPATLDVSGPGDKYVFLRF